MFGNNGFALRVTIPHVDAILWSDYNDEADEADEYEDTSMLQRDPIQISLRQHIVGRDHSDHRPDERIKLDLSTAYEALLRLDDHFILPTFDVAEMLPLDTPWLPCSKDWINHPWFAYDEQILDLVVYFDGSFVKDTDKIGFAAAAFVHTQTCWKFAGASSGGCVADSTGAYKAELKALILALKLSYDILKGHQIQGAEPPTWHILYDSLAVGKQAEGLWKAQKDPQLCQTARSLCLCRLIERQFGVYGNSQHTPSHCGDPGNEAVDVIAVRRLETDHNKTGPPSLRPLLRRDGWKASLGLGSSLMTDGQATLKTTA